MKREYGQLLAIAATSAAARNLCEGRFVMCAFRTMWCLGVVALVFVTAGPLSAEIYTDDFNRANEATLGDDWNATWGKPQLSISSNTAVPASVGSAYVSAYGVSADNASQVIADVEFQANYIEGNMERSTPIMLVGINNTADSWFSGDFLWIQGVAGVKLWVDGDWRDTDNSLSLTAGGWYRATIEQNGADFTGTISTLDGTILRQHTYESEAKTSSTGAAFLGYNYWEAGSTVGSPAFDNFSLTIVPEPGTMALLGTALLGLLCYAWRKRR